MKKHIKLAWRNLWRNKRRTLITVASVFFAVVFTLNMRAFQIGTYDKMKKDVVEYYTGYIQIHQLGFWDKQTINNSMEDTEELRETVLNIDHVNGVIPRLESFTLASAGNQTKGVSIVGISPEEEDKLTKMSSRLVEGEYLQSGDQGIMIGDRLAGFLKLKLNDTIVLVGQGYHGISAFGKYPVKGIFHFGSPEMNANMIFMDLSSAQDFFSAYGMITSLILNLDDPDKLDYVKAELYNNLETGENINLEEDPFAVAYEIMGWDDMLVELVQQIASDNIGGLIWLGILYMIVGFGILGTVMMMISERMREFGVMVAVGTQKSTIKVMIFMEMLFIGILGVILGSIASLPIIIHFRNNPIEISGEMGESITKFGVEPIIPFALEAGYFINQCFVVFGLVLFAFLYPLVRLSGLKVMEAIRH